MGDKITISNILILILGMSLPYIESLDSLNVKGRLKGEVFHNIAAWGLVTSATLPTLGWP